MYYINIKKNTKRILAFGLATVIGLTASFNALHSIYSVEDGSDFLQDNGFEQVLGGQADYFNRCGRNVFAREYQVTVPGSGEAKDQVVCFAPFIGTYLEPFSAP